MVLNMKNGIRASIHQNHNFIFYYKASIQCVHVCFHPQRSNLDELNRRIFSWINTKVVCSWCELFLRVRFSKTL